jgi:hypothetical protein
MDMNMTQSTDTQKKARYSLSFSVFYIAHSGSKVRSFISWCAGAIPQSDACEIKRTSAANFLVAQVAEMRIAEQVADLPTSGGAFLSTARSMDLQSVSLSIASSMDVHFYCAHLCRV